MRTCRAPTVAGVSVLLPCGMHALLRVPATITRDASCQRQSRVMHHASDNHASASPPLANRPLFGFAHTTVDIRRTLKIRVLVFIYITHDLRHHKAVGATAYSPHTRRRRGSSANAPDA